MKKGFTLIELLAVIVILAIVALIATPIILNIIEDAKKSSERISADNYIAALNNAIAVKNLSNAYNPKYCYYYDGVTTCDGEILNVEFDGKIDSAQVLLIDGKVKYSAVTSESGILSQSNSTDENCFVSMVPGEIDGYNCTDTEVYFPADLKLGTVTGFKSISYNDTRCRSYYDENTCNTNRDFFNAYGQTENIDLDDFLQFLVDNHALRQSDIEDPHSVAYFLGSISPAFDIEYTTTAEKTTIKRIGVRAFEDKNLTTVALNNTIERVDVHSFYNNKISNLILPNGLTEISVNAFMDNELTEVILPDTVKVISLQAFAGDTGSNDDHSHNNIKFLKLGKGITEIGGGSFMNNSITEISIPSSVTKIGDFAFKYNKLSNLVIPSTVTNVGINAFDNNCLTSENVTNNSSASFTIDYSNQNNCS